VCWREDTPLLLVLLLVLVLAAAAAHSQAGICTIQIAVSWLGASWELLLQAAVRVSKGFCQGARIQGACFGAVGTGQLYRLLRTIGEGVCSSSACSE
jgi:hypothetical protein